MEQNQSLNRRKSAVRRTSPDDPYCEFKDDRERRQALMFRDLRIVGCRLVTVGGVVTLALYASPESIGGLLAKLLGRF